MEVEMRLSNCADCGMSFALPVAVAKRREEDHKSFFCPNGHPNYYPQKSEAEILRERLRTKERELEEMRTAEQERLKLARQSKPKKKPRK